VENEILENYSEEKLNQLLELKKKERRKGKNDLDHSKNGIKKKLIITLSAIVLFIIVIVVILFATSVIDFSPKYNFTAKKVASQMNAYNLNMINIKVIKSSSTIPEYLFSNQNTSKVEFSNNVAYINAKNAYDGITGEIQDIKNSAEYKSIPPFASKYTDNLNRAIDRIAYDNKYPVLQELSDYQNALIGATVNMQNAPIFSGTIEVFKNTKDCNKRKSYLNSLAYSSNKPVILTSENILIEFDSRFPNKNNYINVFNRLYNGVY
jgi:hypothetical protein